MATKIEFANKVRGDLFTTSNANEVKATINRNADELETVSNSVSSLTQSVNILSQSLSQMKEDNKNLKVNMSETSCEVFPGKLYVWGTVSMLNLTLSGGTSGIESEYKLRFIAGDGFVLSTNETIRWVDEPTWESGWTYEVSIVDGLALCAGWEAQGR